MASAVAKNAVDDVVPYMTIISVMSAVAPLFPIGAVRLPEALRSAVFFNATAAAITEPHTVAATIADKRKIIIHALLDGS